MRQRYKIIAVTILIVFFTACNGKVVDLDRTTNSIAESSSQKNKESSVGENTPLLLEETTQLDLAKEGNPDTVAWLYIPATDIDNPVMQTSNNDDYLKRNENGKYDIWGSYFADYYSVLTNKDSLMQNTVIYGHSQSTENPDGKRFTQLFRYLNINFLKKNPNIYLTVGKEKLTFEIFAVLFTDTGFYYIDPQPSEQGFEKFMFGVNVRNEYLFEGNVVTEQDKLLTLSTCAYRYDIEKTGNQRLVVMAKLVEDNAQVLEVTANPNAQRP